ncbi:MAG: hypothetical protein ACK4YP_02255 [Myxococcota bacterium]
MDPTGTWALEIVVVSVAKAPLFGETYSASRSRLLVRITRDGPRFVQRQTLCATTMEGGTKLARVVIPEGWRAALPDRSYAADLRLEAGAWRYHADTGVQTVGYDPALGGLPRRASDPQTVDADGDGKPGATVLVKVPGFGTAEVFVAQRGHSRLEGRFVSPDRVEGRVVLVDQRQVTLGASHPLFDFTPDTRPDPSRSTFAMWRVDDGARCP